MIRALSFILLIFTSVFNPVQADTPTCNSHSSGNYCSYTGQVDKLYINASNVILMYFDTPIDTSTASGFGFSINNGSAAALQITESNAEFARTFYSTLLAAKMSSSQISIQMKGVQSGYLQPDRIWLY